MLLNRFVFVVYLLLGYTWFLLGTVFNTAFRYVPVVSMMLTLLCVIFVSLMQLQVLLQRNTMATHDKWSSVAWSVQHLVLCAIFCLDGTEWMNLVVVLGLCGLLMTVTIAMVGGCACFVIMQNGEDWHAHVHLACVSFWVMLQFMAARLPGGGVVIVTTIPVALMACVRLFETPSKSQLVLWVVCVALHACRDAGAMSDTIFLCLLAAVVLALSVVYRRAIVTLVAIPLALFPTLLYIIVRGCCGMRVSTSLDEVVRLYNELTAKDLEPVVIPLDDPFPDDDDWNESL